MYFRMYLCRMYVLYVCREYHFSENEYTLLNDKVIKTTQMKAIKAFYIFK